MTEFSSTRALVCALGISAMCVATPASAQTSWRPSRPVTIMVPYSAGGGSDALARTFARQLQTQWGTPVVVENAPGADGLIGTRKVADAKPDGHTLLMQLPSLVLIRHTPSFKGTDPVTQLEPVSEIAQIPGVVAASSKVPGNTLADVVRDCKAAAQPCSFGTVENMSRLMSKMLAAESGMNNLIVVNYKGSGQLMTDLVANNVNFAIMGGAAAVPHQKNGSLKVLATLGGKRNRMMPEVPTESEAGFPNFRTVTWYGLFAPKGTPMAVQQAIASAVKQAVKDESVQKMLDSIGVDPIASTPAEFAAQVRQEVERTAVLVKRFPLE